MTNGVVPHPPVIVECAVTEGPSRRTFLVAQSTHQTLMLLDSLHAGADALGEAEGRPLRELANALAEEIQANRRAT